jgi:acetolactate synthase-1/2/3 large subunit
MVRQHQDLFWDGRRTAVDLPGPDWTLLARGCGVAGRAVSEPGELGDALAATLAEPGPALLQVRIAPEADCLPMFPAGGPAREMIYERRSMSSTSEPIEPQVAKPAFA